MHPILERAEKELAETKEKLAKAMESKIELVCKMAEFTPDQMRKMAPDVKRQVRAEVSAAMASVKEVYGDGTGEGGSELMRQYFAFAQWILDFLDGGQQFDLTGLTTAQADAIGGDVSKLSPVELIKRIHTAGAKPFIRDVRADMEPLGKDDGAKTPLELAKEAHRRGSRDPRDLICYR